MPEFQFTPILTVVTNDQGVLVDLSWDWADTGQGQYNEITTEHDPTAAHESVCAELDKLPKRWTPENMDGPASILGTVMHSPIDRVNELLATITRVADEEDKKATEAMRARNPNLPDVGERTSRSMEGIRLRTIAEEIRAIHGIGEPQVPE